MYNFPRHINPPGQLTAAVLLYRLIFVIAGGLSPQSRAAIYLVRKE